MTELIARPYSSSRLLQSSASMNFDLRTEEGVLSYLTQRLSLDVDPNGVKRLSGGYINFTWQVKLNAPYQGHKSIVLKHAHAHWSSDENFRIGVERLAYEYQALKVVSESSVLSGNDSRVSVPERLHYDVDHNALIMQDVGSLKTLRDYVSAKPPLSAETASLIGSQIGTFIARLHNLGRENKDQPEFKFFSGNIVGRTHTDRLYQTITPNATKYGIDDPIVPIVVKELVEEANSSEDTLIMADLWAGNILLQFGENPSELTKIWLIDWELCRYGPASLDMGCFLGDCFLVARFQDQSVGTEMRQAYLENYTRIAKVPVNYQKITIRVGAYLVLWTDFINWGSDEERKEFVERGVEAFHDARKDNHNGEITSILVKEASST